MFASSAIRVTGSPFRIAWCIWKWEAGSPKSSRSFSIGIPHWIFICELPSPLVSWAHTGSAKGLQQHLSSSAACSSELGDAQSFGFRFRRSRDDISVSTASAKNRHSYRAAIATLQTVEATHESGPCQRDEAQFARACFPSKSRLTFSIGG